MPQLDALRCIAVILVLWQHAGPMPGRGIGNFGLGMYGVWLFFVLSAFLITGILLRVRDTGATLGSALRAFYARRFLRIFPAYYGVLALVAVFGAPPLARGELIAHFLYLSNWHMLGHADELRPFWSLAVEEQFYLVWPLLILRTRPDRLPRRLIGVVLLAVAFRAFILFAGKNAASAQLPTISNLDALGLGALLAWHRYTYTEATGARRRMLRWGLILGVGLLIGVVGASHDERFVRAIGIAECLAVSLVAVWLVDRCATGDTGWWRAALEWRPILFVGTVSYCIYLVHAPLRWILFHLSPSGTLQNGLGLFALLTAVSIAVAGASWLCFEGPINRLKRYVPYPTRDSHYPASAVRQPVS